MKKNIFKYLFISALALTFTATIACRDNKNTDDVNHYDSLPEQERMYDDPDPLNEQDVSGGTIDNHQGSSINATDNMNDNDTIDRRNSSSNSNQSTQDNR